jgi:alkylation response protein AidB-like acyl-CoA dehydrogenase
MSSVVVPQPLTVLTEDESLFRNSVRDFAQAEIAPKARAMESDGRYDPAVLTKLFELGLMGIDVPEGYGGAGGSFFQACLAVEELSRADAAVGVLVDVQTQIKTLRQNRINLGLVREQLAGMEAHWRGE